MAKGLDWVFPVVGVTEWSHGSWMPNTKTHRGRTHPAIDIYATEGTPIVSSGGGRVDSVKTTDIGGNNVRIMGDDGVIYYYAHMQSASQLVVGSRIEKGSLIGFVGKTGSASSTKPHLHFSMQSVGSNQYIDPYTYLTDGYKIDSVPNLKFGGGAIDEIVLPYNPDSFGYAGPDSILGAVMGGDEGPPQSTSAEIVGGVLSSVSNMIAGGERMDYRGLGMTGVRQADLPLLVKEQGDTSAVAETEAEQEGLTVKEVGQQSSVKEV